MMTDPAVITAYATGVVIIIGALATATVKVVSVFRQEGHNTRVVVDAARSHAVSAATAVTTAVTGAQEQLKQIDEKTSAALENTNGNLSNVQQELARRTAREEVLERMVSELTTVLSAQRSGGAPMMPALHTRATDAPVKVAIVEVPEPKKEGTS